MNKNFQMVTAALGGAAAVIVIYQFFKKEIGAGVEAAGDAIDPTNPENIFYSGVNEVGKVISTNKGFDLGKSLHRLFYGSGLDQVEAEQKKVEAGD